MSHDFLFDIPREIEDYLVVLDDFIEREIKPLEAQDDNQRFFDHRREHARTDWDRGPNLFASMREQIGTAVACLGKSGKRS